MKNVRQQLEIGQTVLATNEMAGWRYIVKVKRFISKHGFIGDYENEEGKFVEGVFLRGTNFYGTDKFYDIPELNEA